MGVNGWGQHKGVFRSLSCRRQGGHTADRGVVGDAVLAIVSMQALRYFYEEIGERLWSNYGFVDEFSEQVDWYATSHLAIDQGPIIVMIENHRTRITLEDIYEYYGKFRTA
jgi:hypothetical protein